MICSLRSSVIGKLQCHLTTVTENGQTTQSFYINIVLPNAEIAVNICTSNLIVFFTPEMLLDDKKWRNESCTRTDHKLAL